jgi:hypothetical protein
MANRFRAHYERDRECFSADAYRVIGHPGIAWRVLGWETQVDEDTEWSGYENRTGRIVARMIGDDHDWVFDPTDMKPIDRAAYCGECGAMGCTCDGYDRSEERENT